MTAALTSEGTMRVAAIQMPHGPSLAQNLDAARRLLEQASAAGAELALLPEYFFAAFSGPPRDVSHALRDFLAATSRDLRMAIAANVLEPWATGSANIGVVYADGHSLLEQVKVHPMPREVEQGIVGGLRLEVASVRGRRTGMLVCSDILYPEAARILALQGAQILLNPVMSPYREGDLTREAREALYVARAYDAGAFVIKAGGFNRGVPPVVGRSLMAAPWGLLAHYREEFAPEVLVADLDFDRLAAFRAHQATFPGRRPEVYRSLSDVRDA